MPTPLGIIVVLLLYYTVVSYCCILLLYFTAGRLRTYSTGCAHRRPVGALASPTASFFFLAHCLFCVLILACYSMCPHTALLDKESSRKCQQATASFLFFIFIFISLYVSSRVHATVSILHY